VKQFVAFLKHDDAGRVTPEDVVAFKDARLAEISPRNGKAISPKTIKDSDLAGLKAIFAWAVRNKRMKANPAREVTLGRSSKTQTRSKDFTSHEATAILTHALGVSRGQENPKTFAAKRWAPASIPVSMK
jgi:site-specific recombinase XerD